MDASSKSSVRLKQEKNINLSKCGGAIQKDLDTWEEWDTRNLMKFSKAKYCLLPLGWLD